MLYFDWFYVWYVGYEELTGIKWDTASFIYHDMSDYTVDIILLRGHLINERLLDVLCPFRRVSLMG